MSQLNGKWKSRRLWNYKGEEDSGGDGMNKWRRRRVWIGILICFLVLIYLLTIQVSGGAGEKYSLVKGLAISLYYVFYYCGKWISWQQLGILLLVVFITWKYAEKERIGKFTEDAGFRIVTAAAAVTASFFCVVMQTGSVEETGGGGLVLWCFVMLWLIEFAADCSMWVYGGLMKERKESNGKFTGIGLALIGAAIFILILCIVAGGRYVYPQGDDFEYGAYSHQALVNGEGILGAVRGAVKMVQKSFRVWQGTFSSIFLMALQPGIWGEEYYHFTPLLLGGLLLSAVFFFLDSLFRKVCGARRSEVLWLFLIIAFMITQLVPAPVSVFYWWNGAIHYTGAMAFLLYMLSFTIRVFVSVRKKWFYIIAACLAAVLVGGGNLVTALIGSVLVGYAFIAVGFFKRKDKIKYILVPSTALMSAFIINITAPGNWIRQENSGEIVSYGVIEAIVKSFEVCIGYALGEWTDVFWILMILAALPVLAQIAARIKFSYPLPGIVSVAAFCMLSAMYTPQIFAVGEWDTGRIQNIIYDVFLVLTLLLEFYWLGWMQKQKTLLWNVGMKRKWYVVCGAVGGAAFILTAIADPESMTSTAVISAVSSGEAQEYAGVIWENIKKIKSAPDNEVIYIQEPPQKPEIFKSKEIETWRYGTADYYGKYKIRYYGEK